jgi:hypothetical protein
VNITTPVQVNALNATVPANGIGTYSPKRQVNQPMSVSCSIHPWMSAWLLARDDGYFAVTNPDGTFEIKDLPAGQPVELQVWHEAKGGGFALQQPELRWSKNGRFTVTLTEGETRELNFEVPLAALGVTGS